MRKMHIMCQATAYKSEGLVCNETEYTFKPSKITGQLAGGASIKVEGSNG